MLQLLEFVLQGLAQLVVLLLFEVVAEEKPLHLRLNPAGLTCCGASSRGCVSVKPACMWTTSSTHTREWSLGAGRWTLGRTVRQGLRWGLYRSQRLLRRLWRTLRVSAIRGCHRGCWRGSWGASLLLRWLLSTGRRL